MIRESSRGWSVRYEIFDVCNETAPIGHATWTLDAGEVDLILRQSLQCSPLGHWKLKFPCAISPDLRLVIILRTTFLFEFEELEQDQGLKYSSTVVQPDMPSDRSIYWLTDRGYFSSFTYSYEWHPSFDNRHLVFRDFATESSTPDSLIVFQIIRQGGRHSVIPVNGIQLHDTGISDWHITSHHVKPQLLFVMKKAVWLWTFGKCLASESSRAPIEYTGRRGGTLTRIYELIGVQFPPTGHPNDFSKVSSISLSYCGKYATICIQGANHARVVPLPQDPLENGIR